MYIDTELDRSVASSRLLDSTPPLVFIQHHHLFLFLLPKKTLLALASEQTQGIVWLFFIVKISTVIRDNFFENGVLSLENSSLVLKNSSFVLISCCHFCFTFHLLDVSIRFRQLVYKRIDENIF